MVMQSTCGDCQGQGKSIKTVCSKCNGQTYVEEEKTLRVIIPKGVSNGTTLRMVGKGGRGFNGGEDGDVFVEINVKSPDITKLSDTEQETLRGLLS
jgi:molecular chaperone DnaJ